MQYSLISTLIIAAATFVSANPMPQGGAFASQSIPIAINQNKGFADLSPSDSCDPATEANVCIDGDFAQCVGGAFIVGAGCGGSLECFALPLVNSVGSSVTCTTPEDAAARMGFGSVAELDNTIGGGDSTSTDPAPAPPASATPAPVTETPAAAATKTPAAPATPAPAAGSIASQSIPLAIAQNQSFKGLSASSPCDAATEPNACIDGDFAQCVNGEFVVGGGCGGGLECFALPLVNSVGTSVTCTTPEDAARRMGISVDEL